MNWWCYSCNSGASSVECDCLWYLINTQGITAVSHSCILQFVSFNRNIINYIINPWTSCLYSLSVLYMEDISSSSVILCVIDVAKLKAKRGSCNCLRSIFISKLSKIIYKTSYKIFFFKLLYKWISSDFEGKSLDFFSNKMVIRAGCGCAKLHVVLLSLVGGQMDKSCLFFFFLAGPRS